MPKFLIIRFSSIGDIIQCMSVVSGILNKYPNAQIDWISRKDMGSTLAIDKRINKIWAFNKSTGLKGLLNMADELKKEKYDYVYDAHNNIRSHILKFKLKSIFSKSPKITTRSKERFKRFLYFRLNINRFNWPFRGMESFRKPLAKWGITDFTTNNISKKVEYSFNPDIVSNLSPLIKENTITLVPSANWDMKRWPVNHWKELITLLPDYNFIILAGPTDNFCKEIAAVAPERVNNLQGKTSLIESSYITLISNLVISGDTGFLHSADLFNTPAIALMGPTAFGHPSSPTSKVVELPLPCRPCTKDGRGCCKDALYQRCMVEITPQEIANQVCNNVPTQY